MIMNDVEKTTLKNWDLTVTNLWTKELIIYQEIEKDFLVSLDDDFDSMIFFKPGNAIQLDAKTLDQKYVGSLIFAALEGINAITIEADKIRDPDYIVNFLFLGLIIFAVFYVIRHVRQNLKQQKKEMERAYDPHSLPEIDF